MAFSILYKKLFEVKILHSFFLNEGIVPDDGDINTPAHTPIFYDFTPTKKTEVLERYSLANELEIVPTPETLKKINGHKMVLRQTGHGFIIFIKVEALPFPTNQTAIIRHRPFISFDSSISFAFQIRVKNPNWNAFTNTNLRPRLPAIFYFNNLNDNNDKVTPVLSPPPPLHQAGQTYSMGGLVLSGGSLFEAKRNNSVAPVNGDDWALIDDHQYVTEQDRTFVAYTLVYRFPSDVFVTIASFTLTDSNNNTIDLKEVEEETPIRNVQLRLIQKDADGKEKKVPAGTYTLDITGNGGFSETYKITVNEELFAQKPSEKNTFGIIEIFHKKAGMGNFRILDSNGFLLVDTDNDPAPPTFEIRFKNRAAFWRYLLPKDVTISLANDALLSSSNNGVQQLTTKNPIAFTKIASRLQLKQSNNTTNYLPNPSNFLVREENDQLISEIYLFKKDV